MKRILMIGLLGMGLGGCNGSDGGGSTGSADPFIAYVLALVGTAPEDTEPTDYTGAVITAENSEPIKR